MNGFFVCVFERKSDESSLVTEKKRKKKKNRKTKRAVDDGDASAKRPRQVEDGSHDDEDADDA